MRYFVLTVCVCLQSLVSIAKVRLPSILSQHMVLQQKSKVKLWGQGKPMATVSVRPSWTGKAYQCKTDGSGAWEIRLSTPKAGGPYRISFDDGDGEVIIDDVLLGEVWLCSGQSNMVMPLKGYDKGQHVSGGDSVIALADKYPAIRLFNVAKVIAATPQADAAGTWKISNRQNAPDFSAIAYQFATQLNQKLGVPIGIITTCWGSTAIQSWMSEATLKQFPGVTLSTRMDTLKIPSINPETVTAALYNGMIWPLAGYNVKGFLWYQGESNKNASLYKKLFPAMVSEWRRLWGNKKLAFYYVQIAPFNYQGLNMAFIREVQASAKIPHSGMVVTMDAGQKNRIHPPNKLLIGSRLANWALGKTYKQKATVYQNPELSRVAFDPLQATLTFNNVGKGLHFKSKSPDNFELAAADGVFYPAEATILTKYKIIVRSSKVNNPVAVRYAFKSWADGDLFNSAQLPASSFRTDE